METSVNLSPDQIGEQPAAVVPADALDFQEFAGDHSGAQGPGPVPLSAVHEVPVRVQAVLGRARMPVNALLQLRPGAVVELDRRVGEPVDVFVNNRLVARGEVVMVDEGLGVTLTEIVRADR